MAEPLIDPTHKVLNRRAAALSLGYNTALTVIKLVAALVTGSVALLSEAAHSGAAIVASGLAYFGVRAAAAPPDQEHPYGHGKIESMAALGESILLLGTVGYILWEAGQRLVKPAEVMRLDVGIAVMAFSSITSLALGKFVAHTADRTGSLALKSNGQHLLVDFWTSIAVLGTLVITLTTGWKLIDPIAALALSAWIGYGAIRIGGEAVNELIDRSLPEGEVAKIRAVLGSAEGCLSYHRLRTRHSGHMHYIDVHIVVPNDWSVVRAHDVATDIERRIQTELHPSHVTIHVDPYDTTKSRNH